MNRFSVRIILPATTAILLFILTLFLVVIPRFRENIMNGKRQMIKELTQSAWSILEHCHHQEQSGQLTPEEARQKAVSLLRELRYGDENKDYFWITDTLPAMVMHPFRDDLNGSNLSNFRDRHGKKMFVEFVKKVQQHESGYVDYMWQWKDDSLHIVPKLSYVKIFRPWQWVIGTGIYLEDAKKEIASLTRNLVWLTAGIAALMAFLLFYLLQQSYRIERKRRDAETDLNVSRERYRALVEASDEGLVMAVDGNIIYANEVAATRTGFSITRLINMKLNQLTTNPHRALPTLQGTQRLKEGHHEITIKRGDGQLAEFVTTVSASTVAGKPVDIVILKDITVKETFRQHDIAFHKIVDIRETGLFIAQFNFKGRILWINEKARQIMGFGDQNKLPETPMLRMVVGKADRKMLVDKLQNEGHIRDQAIAINLPDGSIRRVAVTLVLVSNPGDASLLCHGMIADITQQEQEKANHEQLLANLTIAQSLYLQPAKDFQKPVASLADDTPLEKVLDQMEAKETDAVLVTHRDGQVVGIITAGDITHRIIGLKLNLQNPAYLIMSSPLITLHDTDTVFHALDLAHKHSINHLPVRDSRNEITGMLSVSEVCEKGLLQPAFLLKRVESATSVRQLADCYKLMRLQVEALIKNDAPVTLIIQTTSTLSDTITRRVIELSINDLGHPPARFAFLCMGSEGRKEETLFTDQDNAIVTEPVSPDKSDAVRSYFIRLGEMVCDALDTIGYTYCKGDIMARNPQWNQPIDRWRTYFHDWIQAPEPQNLLDAMIFFDFRHVFGDENLTHTLRKFVDSETASKPVFFYHMALHASQWKIPHFHAIQGSKGYEAIDMKGVLQPLVMIARTYALKNQLHATGTLERLQALEPRSMNNAEMVNEMIFSFKFLLKLRLRGQLAISEARQPLSNNLRTDVLNNAELHQIKKILTLLPYYQEKIKIDFKI